MILLAVIAAWLLLALGIHLNRPEIKPCDPYEEIELTEADVAFLLNLKTVPRVMLRRCRRWEGRVREAYVRARGWQWPLSQEQYARLPEAAP